MTFQLTRRAHNEAWSGRTAKVGRPHKTLAAALAAAIAQDETVTITDSESGLWGKVGRFHYAGRNMTQWAGKPPVRISLELPEQWAALVRVDAVPLTPREIGALNTLCELELGSKPDNRIGAWRHLETAQDKLLATMPAEIQASLRGASPAGG